MASVSVPAASVDYLYIRIEYDHLRAVARWSDNPHGRVCEMKRHAIDCSCYDDRTKKAGKAVVCGTKGMSIVYYCHNCCKQMEQTQEKARTR